MSKECAFCGNSAAMTREHIFPASIISRYSDLISTNDKTDFGFRSDLTIKDVCGPCNNGALSKIDSQFLEIFDMFINEPIAPGRNAEIAFDYNLLTRFLLKVSYNSARASATGQKETEILKRYVPYILGQVSSALDILLRLQIWTSAKKLDASTGQITGLVEARFLRSAKIAYHGLYSENFIIRLIAFNSFWFLLIVPVKPTSKIKRKRFLKGFENWMPNPGVLISPHHDKINVPANKTSFIHPSLLNGMVRSTLK